MTGEVRPRLARRSALALAVGALAWHPGARAQDYPSRPIRIITGGPPGSALDTLARLVASEMGDSLGTTIVVENRSGGSGLVASTAGAQAAADGYTMLFSTLGTMAINPAVMPRMPVDVVRDFRGLALAATTPLILVVSPTSPFTDVASLVAAARARPGQLSYGHVGAGSTPSITSAMLGRATGAEFIPVPYNGYPAALNEIIAGRLTFMFSDGTALGGIQGGTLRALAVTTASRSPLLPDVPTLRESGQEIEMSLWFALYVRTGVPEGAARRLIQSARAVMASPAYRERLARLGLEPGTLFGDAFQDFHVAEVRRWGALIPPLGLAVAP